MGIGGTGNRMCGEHQPGPCSCRRVQRGERGLDGIGKRRDHHRVIEILPDLHHVRGTVTHRGSSARYVLVILPTSRVAAPRGCGKHECSLDPVRLHLRNGVLRHRMPIAVPEVHRQFDSRGSQFGFDAADDVAVERIDG